MEYTSPNLQIEENLQKGKGLYISAGSTLQQIKSDLDGFGASLQADWIGAGYEAYKQKQEQLAKAVQAGSEVLQKGSVEIGKMYDAYLEADEKQRQELQREENSKTIMGIFIVVTALLVVVAPILELADLAFETGMLAADEGAVELGELANGVGDSTAASDMLDVNLNTVDNTFSDITVYDAPNEGAVSEISETGSMSESEPVSLNNDEIPLADRRDSGFDTKFDDFSATDSRKIFAPQEPVQVRIVRTSDDSASAINQGGSEDPIIFTDENGQFFVDGKPVPAENMPEDLAGFDPGQELNPPDDVVYEGHEFDNFDFNREEFDPGQELNPPDDVVYEGHEFDNFDFNHEEFDPGRELNPPDDAVYEGHEFDNFDFNHEEFDPGRELNPPDDAVYEGHEFDNFDFDYQAADTIGPGDNDAFEGESVYDDRLGNEDWRDFVDTTITTKKVTFGEDQSTDFFRNDPPISIEGLQPPTEVPQAGPSVLRQPLPQAPQPGETIDPIITEEDGITDITVVNGDTMTTSTYDSNEKLVSVMLSRWDEDLEMWVPYKQTTEEGIQRFGPAGT